MLATMKNGQYFKSFVTCTTSSSLPLVVDCRKFLASLMNNWDLDKDADRVKWHSKGARTLVQRFWLTTPTQDPSNSAKSHPELLSDAFMCVWESL